ncbi:MAG TPA: hypothetical protein VJ123_00800 [Anaerolineales bacterium]|nr:hypothetical protein [Anaerolineales bacterium]
MKPILKELSTMTVKEWAAAYRAVNEEERQELLERLSKETIEESVETYFALVSRMLPLVLEAEGNEELQSLRERDYRRQFERWQRLAERTGRVS